FRLVRPVVTRRTDAVVPRAVGVREVVPAEYVDRPVVPGTRRGAHEAPAPAVELGCGARRDVRPLPLPIRREPGPVRPVAVVEAVDGHHPIPELVRDLELQRERI